MVKRKRRFWTTERTALLMLRWSERARASKIATELGCTRNAVLGKAHRLALKPYTRDETNRNIMAARIEWLASEQGAAWCRVMAVEWRKRWRTPGFRERYLAGIVKREERRRARAA